MFRFQKDQIVANIGGTEVGGQPGEYPTCLIPSIFYDGQKLVDDPVKGEFNKQQAEILLNEVEEISDKTGIPFFIDVMGNTAEALVKFTNFVSEMTKKPFLIDSFSRHAKIETLRYVQDAGLLDRAIYNSISSFTTFEEMKLLKDLGLQSAILLAFNANKPLEKKEILLKGDADNKGLLFAAREINLKNILVDTAVLGVTSIGKAAKSIYSIKQEFGFPAGCAPANALSLWKKLKMGEFGQIARKVCLGSSCLFTQTMGADFVIMGPIEFAAAAFPACAMADAIIASEAKSEGTKVRKKNHPLYKIF